MLGRHRIGRFRLLRSGFLGIPGTASLSGILFGIPYGLWVVGLKAERFWVGTHLTSHFQL